MRRLTFGLVFGLVFAATFAAAQPFPTQIQIAINQLTTGVTVFTNLRNAASAYVNWGTTQGTSGYGIRDSAGSMQFKNSGGSWQDFVGGSSSGAPADATYWVRTANATLSNETIMGSLGTGLVINTTTTGVPTIYAGASCTNQFPRSLSAIGAATCASVSLTADTTGTLTVAKGGTGLTSGTSGGILGFTGTGTLASSGLLTTSALLVGGGAGATPSALGSLGTTTTVLHGNASGVPTFGAVALATDISGFGTGIATALAVNTGSAGAPILFNGALGSPASGTLTNATGLPIVGGTTGTLTLARGGTGVALSDPGADRILFWDDSDGAVTWLTAGTGLQIIGTTLSATTTAVGGSNTQVQFNDSGTFNGDSGMVFNKTTDALTVGGAFSAASYATASNCADSAGDAACGSAAAGSVVVDAADTTTIVSTTAVTATSEIFVVPDMSLGTRLSVTCNTSTPTDLRVTARTAGASFTVTVSAPMTNPLCLSYRIVN